MKGIFLITMLIVAGLGGLYATLSPKLRHKNTTQETAKETVGISSKNFTTPKLADSTNCCPTEDSLILGTWIAVDDPLSKWVFTKEGVCYTYYADTLSDVDTHKYRITDETNLCGYDLSAGRPENRYMEWTSVNDPNDKMCFSIDGLTNEVLNVVLFGTGEFLIFRRPWSNFEP